MTLFTCVRRTASIAVVALSIPSLAAGQKAPEAPRDSSRKSRDTLEAVVVQAVRATLATPAAQSTMTRDDIAKTFTGQDAPNYLNTMPSMTSYSDAGGYSGYSYLRLRGVDQTRINITLDGVPLNDPEDQVLYFSNVPDFLNSIQSVQVQRGVGSSTFGTASYAGSMNFQSVPLATTPARRRRRADRRIVRHDERERAVRDGGLVRRLCRVRTRQQAAHRRLPRALGQRLAVRVRERRVVRRARRSEVHRIRRRLGNARSVPRGVRGRSGGGPPRESPEQRRRRPIPSGDGERAVLARLPRRRDVHRHRVPQLGRRRVRRHARLRHDRQLLPRARLVRRALRALGAEGRPVARFRRRREQLSSHARDVRPSGLHEPRVYERRLQGRPERVRQGRAGSRRVPVLDRSPGARCAVPVPAGSERRRCRPVGELGLLQPEGRHHLAWRGPRRAAHALRVVRPHRARARPQRPLRRGRRPQLGKRGLDPAAHAGPARDRRRLRGGRNVVARRGLAHREPVRDGIPERDRRDRSAQPHRKSAEQERRVELPAWRRTRGKLARVEPRDGDLESRPHEGAHPGVLRRAERQHVFRRGAAAHAARDRERTGGGAAHVAALVDPGRTLRRPARTWRTTATTRSRRRRGGCSTARSPGTRGRRKSAHR